MCNLYSMTKAQDAIRQLFEGLNDSTGNLPSLPGIYPDQMAPVVRQKDGGPELTMMRWGMPSPKSRLSASGRDPGLTNIRNTASGHWRRWLGPENRCVVPFTSFSEPGVLPDMKKGPIWFALDESRPLAFFAGIWTRWTSIRKVKEGETTDNLYGFLTTDANAVVKPIHPKAMPVILTNQDEVQTWLRAPKDEALRLQRPLRDDGLEIVARGGRYDDGYTRPS
ncbi:SOS response-associated peptidase [Tropicimonas sp. S265A]|uniref:SOS response-associated peptidase n=1 Tax=Tropicimonas sp. S265A TaxID=3415134 RepID=UPI003C7AECE3